MTVTAHGTETITTPTGAKHDAPAMPRLPIIEDAGKVTPKDARQLSGLFFDRLQSLDEGTPEYSRTRSTLIEMNPAGAARGTGQGPRPSDQCP
jgi:RNA polymerase sigma-B factor